MKHFWLVRSEDVHNNSGTGIVAEGNIFSDGTCRMHWLAEINTKTDFPSIHDVTKLHGHDGKTRVVFNLPMMEIREAA